MENIIHVNMIIALIVQIIGVFMAIVGGFITSTIISGKQEIRTIEYRLSFLKKKNDKISNELKGLKKIFFEEFVESELEEIINSIMNEKNYDFKEYWNYNSLDIEEVLKFQNEISDEIIKIANEIIAKKEESSNLIEEIEKIYLEKLGLSKKIMKIMCEKTEVYLEDGKNV